MHRDILAQLLSDIGRVRMAVIGDFCLDAYWLLDASLAEMSIETGLETRAVRSQRYSLGGAGNVVSNLVALGVKAVSVFGVVGDDPFGREMLRILSAASVDTRGMRFQ
ncbi:MAG TPA: PfkB family carbohydrate kinase, partial [Spirochaetia bacterium]|nr:PfkB family carbohydrate kinase [Spirochaetia bacterium]